MISEKTKLRLFAALGACLFAACAFGFVYYQQAGSAPTGSQLGGDVAKLFARPAGVPGVDPDATRSELARLGDVVSEADRKGDRYQAASVAENISTIATRMSDAEHAPPRGCLLAVSNLTDGMAAVYSGQRWDSRDRFEAALEDCR